MKKLFKWTNKKKSPATITIVSGLPRSGTSMMMKMLDAGGLPPLTDKLRTADTDNPKGYYEFERVKKLREGDDAWLPMAEGKAVKVISALLVYLPRHYNYRVIFINRDLDEILASQRKMLKHRGEEEGKPDDSEMKKSFKKHLEKILQWISTQTNMKFLAVNYNMIINNPNELVASINNFLGNTLDTEKMIDVVDPNLYRNRQSRGGE